jgi:hypothetical protein
MTGFFSRDFGTRYRLIDTALRSPQSEIVVTLGDLQDHLL